MKIIFMGNSIIACPILNSLNNSIHDLIGVVSNSPKPAGRGRSSMYTPVGQLANELGLNFIPAKSLNDKILIDTLRRLEADIFVVVAFRILPKIILSGKMTNHRISVAFNQIFHQNLLPCWDLFSELMKLFHHFQ